MPALSRPDSRPDNYRLVHKDVLESLQESLRDKTERLQAVRDYCDLMEFRVAEALALNDPHDERFQDAESTMLIINHVRSAAGFKQTRTNQATPHREGEQHD